MITRFAPSPSGLLHLGHAYSAWYSSRIASKAGGRFLLRIEDIDTSRCRREFEEAIYEDLSWLGLEWEPEVRRQSDHLADFQQIAQDLRERGLIYPCFCTRRDIQQAAAAPHGSEGPLYPGTCRGLSGEEVSAKIDAGIDHAWRLNLDAAVAEAGPLEWTDATLGVIKAKPEILGDAVLVRKDIGTSYHIAVVCDDAIQGVTTVTRGLDLLESTHLHRLLQALLGLPVPEWDHHALITDASGKRLAKRDQSRSLRSLREDGVDPAILIEKFERGALVFSH